MTDLILISLPPLTYNYYLYKAHIYKKCFQVEMNFFKATFPHPNITILGTLSDRRCASTWHGWHWTCHCNGRNNVSISTVQVDPKVFLLTRLNMITFTLDSEMTILFSKQYTVKANMRHRKRNRLLKSSIQFLTTIYGDFRSWSLSDSHRPLIFFI